MKNQITSADIPSESELEKLTEFEIKDHIESECISFWEYCAVLTDLKDNNIITPFQKSVLKILYESNEPIVMEDVKNLLSAKCISVKDIIEVQGSPKGLAGVAVQFERIFRQKFPKRKVRTSQNVKIALFLDYITVISSRRLYFVLRSRFRAALAKVFGNKEIKRW